MFEFIKRVLNDEDMTNDGRVYALPFLFSAWGLGTASGVVGIVKGEGIIEIISTLAIIGISLYTGNKYLELKGKLVTATKEQAPTE